ncbi:hypothetical protein F5884DRAFT_106332 [Xylogone sp. PMI_703]|nr:hypothetical protein F5884DRAFT_106332 [Xylogone sp. PMI_703]
MATQLHYSKLDCPHENIGQYPEEAMEHVKTIITSLYMIVLSPSSDWQAYLSPTQCAMAALDNLDFPSDPQGLREQIWIIQGLQDFSFVQASSIVVGDIATWCQSAWLRLLEIHPENVQSLAGLGYWWLQKAQGTLARIESEAEKEELSSNSGNKSTQSLRSNIDSPVYIEVRGYLQPAMDFSARAVRAAGTNLDGDLFCLAAEAQMGMGSVTGPPADQQHFTQALRYLQQARAVPHYRTSDHLRQFLNDYERYII